jgi:glycosyltransferase involved in cell wall biosynthesis
MPKVFLSNLVDNERMPFQQKGDAWGKAHYSWKIIARLYETGFRSAGFDIRKIERPEIYQADIARSVLGVSEGDIHVAVKPIEHLRPFHHLKNLFVCGWEFPEFSDSDLGGSPFLNQLSILRKADAVICWTDYTAANLRALGLTKVHTLPPPITAHEPDNREAVMAMPSLALGTYKRPVREVAVPLGERLAAAKGKKVFLSILNPHDRRKQLPRMLAGFLKARERTDDILLVIKLIVDSTTTTLADINDFLPLLYGFHGASEHVLFCSEYLDEAAMADLMSTASFYLSCSSVEGLNLPVIEAMLGGIPVVTTFNSAMGTYLNSDLAVEIPTRPDVMGAHGNALSDYMKFTHFPPNVDGIADAILHAADIGASRYEELSRRGREAAAARFGTEAFADDLGRLIEELAAR